MKCLLGLLSLFITALTVAGISISGDSAQPSFTIDYDGNTFLKDGQPFQYVSGSIHYFRILPQDWDDRLAKMRAAGLNAVQLYVPWNFHEPQPGRLVFTGQADLEAFLELARKHQLLAIVRAGPYICAEWDFGGLPAWLLRRNASMVLRSSDPQFLAAVDQWMGQLLPRLARHLYSNGGNVIMVQLENEYGSTGQCDEAYIRHLYQLGRRHLGNQTVLFSTDGQAEGFLKCAAKVKLFYPTVDFGTGGTSNLNETFAPLRAIQPKGPLVNSEYYAGWLDNWFGPHSTVPAQPVADGLARMLAHGVSVNLYMFIGGTNFGFWNGANAPPLSPQPTSYDYDAPLTESGDATLKFQLIRQAIANFTGRQPPPVPPNATSRVFGRLAVRQRTSLLGNLESFIVKQPHYGGQPVAMETLGQYQGFALYKTRLPSLMQAHQFYLVMEMAKDFVYGFASSDAAPRVGQFLGSTSFRDPFDPPLLNVTVDDPASVRFLWLLVENCGHVNYGGRIQGDIKGITGRTVLNGGSLYDWDSYAIDFGRLATGPWNKRQSAERSDLQDQLSPAQPAQGSLFLGSLSLTQADLGADTYANLTSFCKGQLWINGFNLGRFWPCAGPQVTVYVPKWLLREGENQVTVLELLDAPCAIDNSCVVDFLAKPNLGSGSGRGGSGADARAASESLKMEQLQPPAQLPMSDIIL